MIHDILKIYSSADGGKNWNPITTSSFYNTKISYILRTCTIIPGAKANPLALITLVMIALRGLTLMLYIREQLFFSE